MVQLLAMREDLRQLARAAEHANGRGAVVARRRARQVVFDQREGALLAVLAVGARRVTVSDIVCAPVMPRTAYFIRRYVQCMAPRGKV